MRQLFFGAAVVVCLFSPAPATAQSPALPSTYSYVSATYMGGPMTIKVNRNGTKEVVEWIKEGGGLHLRQLYDFQTHKVYTFDYAVNRCTAQVYTSAYAPPMQDPIGGAADMQRETATMPVVRKDNVNGVAAKVIEMPLQGANGKYIYWVEEKNGIPLKASIAMGTQPERVMFELRQLNYAPSPESMFATPSDCQVLGGYTNANGGRAETNIGAKASGTTRPGKK